MSEFHDPHFRSFSYQNFETFRLANLFLVATALHEELLLRSWKVTSGDFSDFPRINLV